MTLKTSFRKAVGLVTKRLLATTMLAGLVVGGSFLQATASNGPVFNGTSQDYPLIQVAPAGSTNYATSMSANVGDTVTGVLWIHNSEPNTTAENTRIKVMLPTASESSHTVQAVLSADNAQTLTGNSVISVGATSKINYKVDSAKLYANDNGNLVQVSWPNGVDPNQLVNGGVNLGPLLGCWQFAKAITFQMSITGGNAAVSTEKWVQLAGSNLDWSKSINARPADAINYMVFLQNIGNSTGTGTFITDPLDSRFTFVPNSAFTRTKVANVDVDTPIPDSAIIRNGNTLTFKFSDMLPRPDASRFLVFQVRAAGNDSFLVGTTTLHNKANAGFTSASVDTNIVDVNIKRDANQVITFQVVKTEKNLTLGDPREYDHTQAGTAGPGDTLQYRVRVINTGNTDATNVLVKDILPTGVTFTGNVKLFNIDNPAGTSLPGGEAIVSNGYTFAKLVAGSPGYQDVVFTAQVSNTCSGDYTAKNVATITFNSQVAAQDFVNTNVACQRGLTINKEFRDPSNGIWKKDIGTIHEGDVIDFRITVGNSGNTTARNPIVRDVIPQFTTFVNGSLAIDGLFMTDPTVTQGFLTNGMLITDLNPGLNKLITGQIKVLDCPPLGDQQITNTAYVRADSIAEKSSQATALVQVKKPVFHF